MQVGGAVFNNILNELITHKISCSDTQTFPPQHTKQYHHETACLVRKFIGVCRRREQAREQLPVTDCLHRIKWEKDPAEPAEHEYPISNLQLTSPRSEVRGFAL
ncbi:hypothetical protein CRENBAI_018011 [Crenichthys baileyi]|uniref:Uncharacterized protein n=1 Tax=Crenichthys baileyi TaxID=28760 RepID=A0AAV9SI90_9TELE